MIPPDIKIREEKGIAKMDRRFKKRPVVIGAYECREREIIHTLEGDMTASVGDFVITGLRGEKYPCKPDIFWRTYVEVDKSTPTTHYL